MADKASGALFDETAEARASTGWVLESMAVAGFKGISVMNFTTEGGDVEIHGDNREGKTTLGDAYLWCLTGKNHLGQSAGEREKEFRIRPLDAAGDADLAVDPTVELVFTSPSGNKRTFKRTWRAKMKTDRARAEKVFDGNETLFWIDGVDKTETEYDRIVSGLADGDKNLLACLLNSRHFNEGLGYEERRVLLMSMLPVVTDEDVTEAVPEIAPLIPKLDGRTVDEYRKVKDSERGLLSKRIDALPAIIAEARRNVPESVAPVGGVDLTALRKRRQELSDARAVNMADKGSIEAARAVAEAEAAVARSRAEDSRSVTSDWSAASTALARAKSAFESKKSEVENARRALARAKTEADDASDVRQNLLKKHEGIKDRKFVAPSVKTVCETCGQAIPADRIEEAAKNALEAFNKSKAEELEAVIERGKQARKDLEAATAALKDAEGVLAGLEPALKEAEAMVAEASAAEEAAKRRLDTVPDSETTKAAVAALEAAKQAKAEAGNKQADTSKADAEIEALDMEIEDAERAAAIAVQKTKAEARVEELTKELKDAGAAHESAVREIMLCDAYTRAKVALLEGGINARFEVARFKLFRVQLNGLVVPCCETMLDGVPYGSLNSEGQVNVGIDVVNALARHHKKVFPVFIDNGESVTSVYASEGQQIRLYKVKGQRPLTVLPKSASGGWINEARIG